MSDTGDFIRAGTDRNAAVGNHRGAFTGLGGRECLVQSWNRTPGSERARNEAEALFQQHTGKSPMWFNDRTAKSPEQMHKVAREVAAKADKGGARSRKVQAAAAGREGSPLRTSDAGGEPAVRRERQDPGQLPPARPVVPPSWVGANRAADKLEQQHTGALGGGKETHTVEASGQRELAPVHTLPAWGWTRTSEASR